MSRAKLFFTYSTMNAGKSLQLMAKAHNFEERGIPIIVLKPSIDTRNGDDSVFSRAIGKRDCITVKPNDDILDLVYTLLRKSDKKMKWILVDEAQFLSEVQVDQLAVIVDTLNINVICYGLRTDFQTHLFSGSKRLFEVADTIEEIKSSCDCENKTIFNARIDSNGNVVTEGEQIEIGGEDKYIALCRNCYYKKTKNKYYRLWEHNH